MACGCSKNRAKAAAVVAEATPAGYTVTAEGVKKQTEAEIVAVAEAMDIGLKQCYLCAKKHLGRAQAFFEEYHTGYPDHLKNLVDSLFDAHTAVYKAFQLWQRVQNQMDMSAGELLGNKLTGRTLHKDHIELAAEIRAERLKFDENPLYVPDFDGLRYKIHRLQHIVLNEELNKNA